MSEKLKGVNFRLYEGTVERVEDLFNKMGKESVGKLYMSDVYRFLIEQSLDREEAKRTRAKKK